MNSTIKHDIVFLDFLRGWSAVLVFFHHAAILGGGPNLLRGDMGKEAVNAFMLASGFLIYFQCATSSTYDHLQSLKGIRNFYIRRYFRIAPAYYIALMIALLMSVYLGQFREQIAGVLPSSATSMDRYYIADYVTNALVHFSFVFGMLPQYSFSTPLPDWSLGLEMQFYLVFPLLYMVYRRNFIIFLPITLLLMFGIWRVLIHTGVDFPMPSLLPLKFHNFAAGMALAYLMLNPSISLKLRALVIIIVLLFLIACNRSLHMPLLFIFGSWLLTRPHGEHGLAELLNRIFAHRSSKYLADVSYSLYILHLMIMIPFFAWVLKSGRLDQSIWLLASGSLLALTLVLAYISYRFVEIPGINLGKRLLHRPTKARPRLI